MSPHLVPAAGQKTKILEAAANGRQRRGRGFFLGRERKIWDPRCEMWRREGEKSPGAREGRFKKIKILKNGRGRVGEFGEFG